MTKFYIVTREGGKELCKSTTVIQAKREATRRYSQPYSSKRIHLIEVDDGGKVISAYSKCAGRANRWFRLNGGLFDLDRFAK